MVVIACAAGQIETAQIAFNIYLHRQRRPRRLIKRRRQATGDTRQVTVDTNVIFRPGAMRQFDVHFAFPAHTAAHRITDLLRHYARFRRLPVAIEIHRYLIGFRPFGSREINVHRLVKPHRLQWFAFQIAVNKAERTPQILHRAVKRFNKQVIVVENNIAFRRRHFAVERNIKM